MRLHVKFRIGDLAVDDIIEGEDALEITRKAKQAVAGKMGLLVGSFVKSMPDLEFAREVVLRYNAAAGASCPAPASLEAFVGWAVAQKLATEVEETSD